MRVPLLDLSEQYRALEKPIQEAIAEVLRTQHFVLGEKVDEFERAICRHTGAKFAIGVSSGTDALLAILMAMGIGPGDAVITTAYTFFATAGCVARVGARPIFVDIEPTTYNLDPRSLRTFLQTKAEKTSAGVTYEGHKICALVPVHLFGLCCEMDELAVIAAEYDIPIIEDAAQAIGAEFPSNLGVRQAGTMGRAGYFSFYPSKNLGAAGDAGLIVTNDEGLTDQLRIIRQHGMEKRYFHGVIGGNFRLDALQAAILGVKLPHLDAWSAARRRVADAYGEEFRNAGLTSRVTLPTEPYRDRNVENHHIFHQYVIRAPQRDELKEHLQEQGIDSAIYYPLGLHEQVCFSYLGYQHGDLPQTEAAARETLALSIYPELTRDAQNHVVSAIAEFYRAN